MFSFPLIAWLGPMFSKWLGLSALGGILKAVPWQIWAAVAFAALVGGAYLKGTWDGQADERAAWVERVKRLEATNQTLTDHLNEKAAREEALAAEAQRANDELAKILEGDDSRDLFPDDWLRNLGRTR